MPSLSRTAGSSKNLMHTYIHNAFELHQPFLNMLRDAALGESIGKDAAKDAINKKGERDIHLKFDTAKEKRDWTESLKAHMAYGANLTQNTNDGKN